MSESSDPGPAVAPIPIPASLPLSRARRHPVQHFLGWVAAPFVTVGSALSVMVATSPHPDALSFALVTALGGLAGAMGGQLGQPRASTLQRIGRGFGISDEQIGELVGADAATRARWSRDDFTAAETMRLLPVLSLADLYARSFQPGYRALHLRSPNPALPGVATPWTLITQGQEAAVYAAVNLTGRSAPTL